MATSTRREASASFIKSFLKARKPSFKAVMAAPCIEPEVSTNNTQGQRGSGFSANSTASAKFGVATETDRSDMRFDSSMESRWVELDDYPHLAWPGKRA